MNFNEKQLKNKWKNKKQSCNQRGIKMLLTKDEFCFLYNNHDMICEYTGEKMNTNSQSDNFISLERIDEKLPYQAGNICFVTKVANQIKGGCFDHKTDSRIVLQGKHRGLFFKLVDIVKDNDKINNLKQKYSQENITKMMAKTKNTTPTDGVLDDNFTTSNPEIIIAKLYASLGQYFETKCNSEFNLSYSEFKKVISRKRCQLTNRELPDDFYMRRIFVVDKSLPVSKSNVLVTDKLIQDSLDTMIVSAKLNLHELKSLCKVVSR